VFGEVNGKTGVWGHAIGGMGAITQAMAAEARRLGVTLETDAPVKRIIVERGRATGIEARGLAAAKAIHQKQNHCIVAARGKNILNAIGNSGESACIVARLKEFRVHFFSPSINLAARLPISTAKLVPRSQG
jgi:phytoene dehydrogenase-like protein